jgi:trigger factor
MTVGDSTTEAAGDAGPAQEKLTLDVDIQKPSACLRHVVVTVSADDVKRYRDKVLDELEKDAFVPGFRPGRAPRGLVASRYKSEIANQVLSTLFLAAMEQVASEHKLVPISEPDIDLDQLKLPDEGPVTFEFNIEVRPDFELPNWKGLVINVPDYVVTDEDVEEALRDMLREVSQLQPVDRPAQWGDHLTLRMRFMHNGEVLRELDDVGATLLQVLVLRDARIDDVDKLLVGQSVGAKVMAKARLGDTVPRADLRGQMVDVELEVLEVKQHQLPQLSSSELSTMFDCASMDEVRQKVRESLIRKCAYDRDEAIAEQISAQLLQNADWDVPEEMLLRQTRREIERIVYELQSRGMPDEEIEARSSLLRQNAREKTLQALRRHFILERIAEEENITVSDKDFDELIETIAAYQDESPRRVRARLEKRGTMDVLRNQVLEQRVLDLIQQHAQLVPVPAPPSPQRTSIVSSSVFAEKEIPEARTAEPQKLRHTGMRG